MMVVRNDQCQSDVNFCDIWKAYGQRAWQYGIFFKGISNLTWKHTETESLCDCTVCVYNMSSVGPMLRSWQWPMCENTTKIDLLLQIFKYFTARNWILIWYFLCEHLQLKFHRINYWWQWFFCVKAKNNIWLRIQVIQKFKQERNDYFVICWYILVTLIN